MLQRGTPAYLAVISEKPEGRASPARPSGFLRGKTHVTPRRGTPPLRLRAGCVPLVPTKKSVEQADHGVGGLQAAKREVPVELVADVVASLQKAVELLDLDFVVREDVVVDGDYNVVLLAVFLEEEPFVGTIVGLVEASKDLVVLVGLERTS